MKSRKGWNCLCISTQLIEGYRCSGWDKWSWHISRNIFNRLNKIFTEISNIYAEDSSMNLILLCTKSARWPYWNLCLVIIFGPTHRLHRVMYQGPESRKCWQATLFFKHVWMFCKAKYCLMFIQILSGLKVLQYL